jgi:hypothetical protein
VPSSGGINVIPAGNGPFRLRAEACIKGELLDVD